MNRSLRLRLTVAVLAVFGGLLAAFSVVLYEAVGRALWREFDERLEGEARAVAGMVEERPDSPWDYEYSGSATFDASRRAAYFQIWLPDGSVVARSPSLGTLDLPRLPESGSRAGTRSVPLPDGSHGRSIQASLPARWDSESGLPEPAPPRRLLTVVVARRTEEIDVTLSKLRHWLWLLGSLTLLIAAGSAVLTVSRGLRPIGRLAAEIERIDDRDLAKRLVVRGLPKELEPLVGKLNGALARLAESFARERRFTASVSHELRTPIAALRTLLEVTSARDRPAADYRAAIREASEIVLQMQSLAESLLMLGRLEMGQIDVLREPIDLRPFVDECWRPCEALARRRRLSFQNEIGEDCAVPSDREKLRLVLINLFSNAAEYTGEGGRVWVSGIQTGGVLLDVCDSGPPIPEAVLPRLFDPFFRADPARSRTGMHAGIGLTLVQTICTVLDLTATVSNLGDGSVRFRVQTKEP